MTFLSEPSPVSFRISFLQTFYHPQLAKGLEGVLGVGGILGVGDRSVVTGFRLPEFLLFGLSKTRLWFRSRGPRVRGLVRIGGVCDDFGFSLNTRPST